MDGRDLLDPLFNFSGPPKKNGPNFWTLPWVLVGILGAIAFARWILK